MIVVGVHVQNLQKTGDPITKSRKLVRGRQIALENVSREKLF